MILKRVLSEVKIVNSINKRLIILAIVITVCNMITISWLAWTYFATDYSYPSINQTQNTGAEINVRKGDK